MARGKGPWTPGYEDEDEVYVRSGLPIGPNDPNQGDSRSPHISQNGSWIPATSGPNKGKGVPSWMASEFPGGKNSAHSGHGGVADADRDGGGDSGGDDSSASSTKGSGHGHGNGHRHSHGGGGLNDDHVDRGGRHPHGRHGQGSVDPVHNWRDGFEDMGEAEPTQYNPLMGNTGLNAYPLPGAMQVLALGAPAWEWPVQPWWGLRHRISTPWPHGASYGWIRPLGGHWGGRR